MEVELLYDDLEGVSAAGAPSEQAVESTKVASVAVVSEMPSATAVTMPFLHIYPLNNYTFGVKETGLGEWETSYHHRMASLEAHYSKYGMKRTVEAVLITYEHNHPHILLMQLGESNIYKLPGDCLKVGEDEYTALPQKLDERLSPPGSNTPWSIEPECLGVWYRPNFDNPVYPYTPAHVLHPKERISLFLVRLPSQLSFALPRGARLTAVPLCDLYENGMRYGPIIAGLPHILSRFNIVCL